MYVYKYKLNEELIAFAEAWPHLKKQTFEEMHEDENKSDYEVDTEKFLSESDSDPKLEVVI